MFNIEKFNAEISTKGVMRSNRFLAHITIPEYLKKVPSLAGVDQLTLRCEQAQLPGMAFTTADNAGIRLGYGPMEGVPYGVAFDDIGLVFILDAEGKVYKFFYEWVNRIVNFQAEGQNVQNILSSKNAAYEVGYKDYYCADITIDVFDTTQDPEKGKKILSVKLFRAYPKALPSIDLNWASESEIIRLPIEFNYTDYKITFEENPGLGKSAAGLFSRLKKDDTSNEPLIPGTNLTGIY